MDLTNLDAFAPLLKKNIYFKDFQDEQNLQV